MTYDPTVGRKEQAKLFLVFGQMLKWLFCSIKK